MIKLDFKWLLKISRNSRTKKKIRFIQKYFNNLEEKDKLVELKQEQRFPFHLGKYKIWANSNNVFQSLHTYTEIFKEKDHVSLREFYNERIKTVVDVGANEGYYVLKIREISPRSRIIAIEPNSEAFNLLEKNIEENKIKNVTLVKSAITDKKGKSNFYFVKGVTQVGGFKLIDTSAWIDSKKIKKKMVKTTRLDDVFDKYGLTNVDILKIDAEGSEFKILRSSRKVLTHVSNIVVEYHAIHSKERIISFMEKMGFKLKLDEKVKFGDLYFIKRNNSNGR